MKKQNILLIMIIGLMLIGIGFVSAETYKLNSNITIHQSCNNCTYCSATVFYPNSTKFIDNQTMTKSGTNYNYLINSNNFSVIGNYIWTYLCGNSDELETGDLDFIVTASGYESASQSNAGIYFILVIASLFFIGFLFIKEDIFKWTFFLLFLFFVMIGVNMISISIYNEIGNTQLGNVFDNLSAISMYIYWFIGGLLLIMWIFTTVASLADRKRMKEAEQTGALTNFKYT